MATERKKTGSRSSSSAGRKTSGRSRKRNKKQSTVQEAIGFALIVLGVFSFAAVVIGGAGWARAWRTCSSACSGWGRIWCRC